MSWWDYLAAPFRAIRDLFPFTREGRQTLVYLVFALAGPALTFAVLWSMKQLQDAKQWEPFANMAFWVLGSSLVVTVIALGMFVSIRAVKIGKDGIDAQGTQGGGDDPTSQGT